jgi:signal transduction histidine kinase
MVPRPSPAASPAAPATQSTQGGSADPGASRPDGLIGRLRQHLGLRRSVKRRLVLMFLVLTVLLGSLFAFGAQRAFSVGWRDAARPVVADYVERLAADIAGADGQPPSIARAEALVARLPLTVRIEGPVVNWASHPSAHHAAADNPNKPDTADWAPLFERLTADGHRIRFGLNREAFERRPRFIGPALLALLVITIGAYAYVRHLLRPLDDIAEGAQRFGSGHFEPPIPVRHPDTPDELGQLAQTVNTMGQDIARMLEAKRALLLAISHELRSPLTRARLHAELLPESGDAGAQRAALLRDLQEMASLIHDLLDSERLAGRHEPLQRTSTDMRALAQEVLTDLRVRHPKAHAIQVQPPPDGSPLCWHVDAARLRLLLRNLLDNALRHGDGGASAPTLQMQTLPDGSGLLTVCDTGPGVPEAQRERLAEAFYRPDAARTREAGGVGLGLYLCRLIAEAHGGRLTLHNRQPGLMVRVTLPAVTPPRT